MACAPRRFFAGKASRHRHDDREFDRCLEAIARACLLGSGRLLRIGGAMALAVADRELGASVRSRLFRLVGF